MSQAESSLPKVSLKPLAAESLTKILAWRNDQRIFRWCRQCEPISESAHRAWFESIHSAGDIKMFGIHSGESELIGVCGLTSIDWINRRAEFSLYISPEHHGKGCGESALRRLLRVGFSVFNLNCIWGESFEGNPAVETFKRVGFHFEGKRRSFYFREGKYIDANLWSILRGEYV